ncbi:cbb3-type cytochrome oxidase subunit 3 [Kaarinaea lacus]
MNSIEQHFYTDWGAMTLQDWLGLIVTVVVFFLMIGLYVYVFHPSNKERLEAQRHIPLDDILEKDEKNLYVEDKEPEDKK